MAMPISAVSKLSTLGVNTDLTIVDADIHSSIDDDTLRRFLSPYWRNHYDNFGRLGYTGSLMPRAMPKAARHDAWPPDGAFPGSNLAFMQNQLLDEWNIKYGILLPLTGAGDQINLDFSQAMARAVNDWQIEDWTSKEPRLRGSIMVPYEDGSLSAEEIHRVGNHPHMVQVLLVTRTREPLGSRRYWPIYEAALEYDLPIAIHFGSTGGHAMTGAGWPSFYIEDHAGMSQSFQSQITSMVSQGLFELFPELKIVIVEGGVSWMVPLMWRMDKVYQQLSHELPRVKEMPSTYIRKHFWISTQPIEEPLEPHQFPEMLNQLDMTDRLLFATDYPHWDFDSPDRAIPNTVSSRDRRRIMGENALELYGLTA